MLPQLIDEVRAANALPVTLTVTVYRQAVGTGADGDDATRQALAVRPDVVLMDLSMPGCDGVAATRRILEAEPGIRVVVLTTYSDDRCWRRSPRGRRPGAGDPGARGPDRG